MQPPAGLGNVDLHPPGVTLNVGPKGPGALNITIPVPPFPPVFSQQPPPPPPPPVLAVPAVPLAPVAVAPAPPLVPPAGLVPPAPG